MSTQRNVLWLALSTLTFGLKVDGLFVHARTMWHFVHWSRFVQTCFTSIFPIKMLRLRLIVAFRTFVTLCPHVFYVPFPILWHSVPALTWRRGCMEVVCVYVWENRKKLRNLLPAISDEKAIPSQKKGIVSQGSLRKMLPKIQRLKGQCKE